jgi:hypothetical protein
MLQDRKPQRYNMSNFFAFSCLYPYVLLFFYDKVTCGVDMAPLVSLPSQWVTSGRIAWAFARDVSSPSTSHTQFHQA